MPRFLPFLKVCPYCRENSPDTDDHVFPQFLGGKAEIPSCSNCNNKRFGGDFEGKVSQDLAPLVVALDLCGLRPARPAVWKRAYTDPTTRYKYDLQIIDGQPTLSLTRPYPEEDAAGKIQRILYRDAREARKHLRLKKEKENDHRKYRIDETDERIDDPPLNKFQFNIGAAMRRLATKMCVAVAEQGNVTFEYSDENSRNYLLNGDADPAPVRISYLTYDVLEELRPPLAHLVYIEGNNSKGKCLGIVQLYGVIQLYIVLHEQYGGEDFARIGILDAHAGDERITDCEPLKLAESPRKVPADLSRVGPSIWLTKLDLQVYQLFGRNRRFFGPESEIRGWLESQNALALIREGSPNEGIPILWVNYFPSVAVEIELRPKEAIQENFSLLGDLDNWVFLKEDGEVRVIPFVEFAEKWNAQEIERTYGKEFTYAPHMVGTELVIDDKYRFDVVQLRMRYEVKRKALFGWQKGDLPRMPDNSWEPINDPEQFEASMENLVSIENWRLSRELKGLRGYFALTRIE